MKKASPKTAGKAAKRSTKRVKPTEPKVGKTAPVAPGPPVAEITVPAAPAAPVAPTPAPKQKHTGKTDMFRAALIDNPTKSHADVLAEFNASPAGPVSAATAGTVEYHVKSILRILSARGALEGPLATHRMLTVKRAKGAVADA